MIPIDSVILGIVIAVGAFFVFDEQRKKYGIFLFASSIFVAVVVYAFLLILYDDNIANHIHNITNGKDNIIIALGWIMGGLLAIINIAILNKRATAQIQVSAEQAKANQLTEKGHIQEQFKMAIEHLGKSETRISAYYEFYQLAEQHQKLQKNIFDILCAHLRQTTTDENYKGKGKPTEEVQTLLNLLFKSKDKFIFHGLQADLRRVNLVGASLFDAHMPNTDFTHACLIGADMRCGKFHNCCFVGARMDGVWLDDAEMILAYLANASLRGSRLQNTNMQMAKLGNRTDFRGSYLSNTKMQQIETSSIPLQIPHMFMGGTFCTNRYEDYESIINRRQGKSGFPNIISYGDLSENDVIETVDFLNQYSNKKLAAEYKKYMQKHINQPQETNLPSGCDLIKYTQEDAKQWINEYKKAMGND